MDLIRAFVFSCGLIYLSPSLSSAVCVGMCVSGDQMSPKEQEYPTVLIYGWISCTNLELLFKILKLKARSSFN